MASTTLHKRERITMAAILAIGATAIAATAIAAITAPALVYAAEGPVGIWDATMNFQGNEVPVELAITEGASGGLEGTMTGRRGEQPMQDVKFEDGKLTFKRIANRDGQEFELNFEGTIDGDTLEGNLITPMGEIPLSGTRRGASIAAGSGGDPLLGDWDIEMDFQGNVRNAKLSFSEKDGSLAGTYTSNRGENQLKNIAFEGGKLTFSRTVNYQGQEFDLDFEGTVENGKLAGNFITQMGEFPVTGTRPGAGGAAASEDLAGAWEAVLEVPNNDVDVTIVFSKKDDGSLAGTFTSPLGATELKNIKYEGGKLSFTRTVDYQGQVFDMDFEGTVANGEVEGSFSTQMGDFPLKGKRATE